MKSKLRTVTIAVTATMLTIAATGTLAVGYHPELRLATGDSMEPTIEGPAVVYCDAGFETVEEGDIVAVNPGSDRLDMATRDGSGAVLHRVTFIDDDVSPVNIKTQGDNEASSDGYSDVEDVACLYRDHVTLPA